jgi:hypothetical protein
LADVISIVISIVVVVAVVVAVVDDAAVDLVSVIEILHFVDIFTTTTMNRRRLAREIVYDDDASMGQIGAELKRQDLRRARVD